MFLPYPAPASHFQFLHTVLRENYPGISLPHCKYSVPEQLNDMHKSHLSDDGHLAESNITQMSGLHKLAVPHMSLLPSQNAPGYLYK